MDPWEPKVIEIAEEDVGEDVPVQQFSPEAFQNRLRELVENQVNWLLSDELGRCLLKSGALLAGGIAGALVIGNGLPGKTLPQLPHQAQPYSR